MSETQRKKYGRLNSWIVGDVQYSDGLDVVSTDETRTGTIPASFTGTLSDAILNAPELGSASELLDPDLRLYRRTFTQRGAIVSATFTYGVFEDEKAKYKMTATPTKIALLSHARFKSISDVERVLAQEFLNGASDSTVVYRNKKGTQPELAQSVPDSEAANWEKTTMKKLVEKYAPSSAVVRMARKGVKELDADAITWIETKITKSIPSVSRLGEWSSPRGNNPSGHKWKVASIEADELEPDEWGNKRYKVTTQWKTDDDTED